VQAQLDSPTGEHIQADYLIDAITSASIATGVVSDQVFTEIRQQGTLGVGKEWNINGTPLMLQGFGRFSYEPDYFSRALGIMTTVSMNQRATVLQVNLNYNNDNVGRIIRGLNRESPTLSATKRMDVGTLQGLALYTTLSHVFSPVFFAAAGYDLGILGGYLANPYRTVNINGVPLFEVHPDQRLRHTVYLRLQYYIPETRSAVHIIPRVYFDSWNIVAINPELWFVQEITDDILMRLKLRYYIQSDSFFYKPQADYTLSDPYRTSDPKMTAFRNTLLGLQSSFRLGFLSKTFLDFARNGVWDISFEYIWNTNSFGNGIIAQSGLRIPF
jgi:hypothetical protein